MNTKERIIEMAISLFNEHGTGAVSTNHIAQELNISTGNLYYYFKNKEEIIREILEKMIVDWDALWAFPSERLQPNLDSLQTIIRNSMKLEWKYRFFYRELIVLMKSDAKLKHRHQEIQTKRMTQQKHFIQQFIEDGLIRTTDTQIIQSLLTANWIISNYWLSYLETSGDKISEEKMEEGIQLIMTIIKPYINT